ncbi:Uncharacterised protein [Mycobacteroides abscessus subsp. abscessus]|nr:Uncharacterised protein [Mycobacteroides abscessus subsp. abscessus]
MAARSVAARAESLSWFLTWSADGGATGAVVVLGVERTVASAPGMRLSSLVSAATWALRIPAIVFSAGASWRPRR